jgi:benzoyl-CoA reductase/2-hydroxyglutaryl-CoA dehydratase subunit BcrC/BadD/HgdB
VFGTAEARQAYVEQVMRDAGASGVILTHLPMCDFWGFEKHNFDAYAGEHDIPVLSLNVDYIVANTGQMATRVQAFVETLSDGGH